MGPHAAELPKKASSRHEPIAALPTKAPKFPPDAYLVSLSATSPTARELEWVVTTHTTAGPALAVHLLTAARMSVAADELPAISALRCERAGRLGPLPLIRAEIEHCARVVWMLEPTIGPDRRIARAMLDGLFSAEARCAAAPHSDGTSVPGRTHARVALRRLRSDAATIFPASTLGGGSPAWRIGGERFLWPAEVAEHFGAQLGEAREWIGTYDSLSALPHPDGLTVDVLDRLDEDRAGADELLQGFVSLVGTAYVRAARETSTYFKAGLKRLDRWGARLDALPGSGAE